MKVSSHVYIYIYVRDTDFSCVSTLFLLDFQTVPMVFFVFHFILFKCDKEKKSIQAISIIIDNDNNFELIKGIQLPEIKSNGKTYRPKQVDV